MITKHASIIAAVLGFLVSYAAGTPAANTNPSGSMINPSQYRGIAADRRAFRVGDTLTILVLEAAQAESQADTGAANKFQVQGSLQDGAGTHNVGLGLGGSTDGSGQTSRQGTLQAEMSVRVIAVEPNHLLHVKGEQTIVINGEKQKISIDGLVRDQDIGPNNTVISNRLSDAHIVFEGTGDVGDSQKKNILYRFLNWLGLI